ncbi:NADH-quinone oxidoreductase subunit NuoK [Polymorphobacter fuscus]|uniref:NADH-quinone oxidoreductase subunit K n=1 Tax=Sandarakinorhabdus fusca TaxID=1439888 RepID=A0A7C9KKI4_9SPHN|nr:NADH-quinone oxidoreductase subunit NuoK [Polymorphobacter fuscus]KAB7643756.1 NADH-quinone oxidoreductase subunit NuoK [Polymorphobacter fuscus]MQT18681.1 NADH-quinone oxidoreductase subunit NuoK [Polymorphobacter fuscus]
MLAIAAALFAIGLFGVMARRGVLFQLLSLEIMLSGPALAFVAAGSARGDPQGQGMFILILVLAAAEVAIGLSLYLRLSRIADVTDSDSISDLQG